MKNKKKLSRGEIKEIQSILTKAGWEQTTYRDRKYGGYEFGQPNTPWVNILDTREAVIIYPGPMNNIWSGDCWDFTATIERLVKDAWEVVAGESGWKPIPGGRYRHPDKEYCLDLPLADRFFYCAPQKIYCKRLGRPVVTITNDELLAELCYKTPKEEIQKEAQMNNIAKIQELELELTHFECGMQVAAQTVENIKAELADLNKTEFPEKDPECSEYWVQWAPKSGKDIHSSLYTRRLTSVKQFEACLSAIQYLIDADSDRYPVENTLAISHLSRLLVGGIDKFRPACG